MAERKAHIFNIQKYNMYDGPGVRTLVFFKGCPLRCLWCSNPEGQLRQPQVLLKQDRCIDCGDCVPVCPVGIHRLLPGSKKHEINQKIECIGCGKCEAACKQGALAITGGLQTISQLLEVIEEDRPFYEMSGGGVTLGGGEVLMQPKAAASLLMSCKQRGINTAIETCGYARPEVIKSVAEFTDLFLFDIKHMNSERHRELTGVRNELILSNVQWLLENRFNVRIRVPVLRGVNDGETELAQLIDFLRPYLGLKNFKGVDILPYHKMGVNKYRQLGWDYPIEGPVELNTADLERIESYFKLNNFPVSVIQH
ncbi:choline TMA-lyase-activating enzyme [Desulfotalea psychrophila]|uniref:Related to pyruvate formate-lyase activating enzyme n=1 Tax=Desulfotalea psychrophila (strain LSv54 / DSM 12343) TaxID=177439 RepID=Q6AM72_DESPS|nr:choline TMA-lyase-activating enzyme [Desulfotalea psychrophila]CAG36553.1 related to pyruvate formate-lyase activating enzyme [Desulfotalea psychrophila LSv54]